MVKKDIIYMIYIVSGLCMQYDCIIKPYSDRLFEEEFAIFRQKGKEDLEKGS